MMKLGHGLIARQEELWLEDHCSGLIRCKTIKGLDHLVIRRDPLIDLSFIILPTGWWQPDFGKIWEGHKTRPAIISLSDFPREHGLFISDCVSSLACNDDCIPAQYDQREMLARIEAIYRRTKHNAPLTSVVSGYNGRVVVDLANRVVSVDGVDRSDRFTKNEISLIVRLASRAGQPLTKRDICDAIMSLHKLETLADPLKHVDVYICRIRAEFKRLGIPGDQIIGTIWGRGHVFDVPTPPKLDNPHYRRGPRSSWNTAQSRELETA